MTTLFDALVRAGIFVSAAQDIANLAGTGGGGTWGSIVGTLSAQADLNAALAAKAALASPTFTGNPAAPTQTQADNSTKIATTAYVDALGATKAPFAAYTLSTSTAITHATHANRIGFCTAAGATTQTFAATATSGALDGDVVTILNVGTGLITLAGTDAAQPGFKLTARKGEVVTVVYQATGDHWVSFTPAYNVIQANDQIANYTTTLADIGRDIRHPASDNNARTFTIDSHSNVTWPDGACIGFINRAAASLSIAITTDTMTLVGTTSTGTRALAQNGQAIAKFDSTVNQWVISGVGLT